MSLINRMLGDLAARQAPGAEAIGGVHLNEPLQRANTAMSRRAWMIFICVVILAAIVIWKITERPEPPPPPKLRMSAGLGDHAAQAEGQEALITTAELSAQSAPQEEVAIEHAVSPVPPRLRLVDSIKIPENLVVSTLRAAERPLTKAAAIQASRERKQERRNNAADRKAKAAAEQKIQRRQAPVAEPTLPAARKPVSALAASAENKKLLARSALASGDAQAALDGLGSASPADDLETTALRAAALQRLQRHKEALQHYTKLTVAEPGQPSHLVGMGISLEGVGQSERAVLSYRRALASAALPQSLRSFASKRVLALERP